MADDDRKPRGEKSLEQPAPTGKPPVRPPVHAGDEDLPPEAAAELERQRDA